MRKTLALVESVQLLYLMTLFNDHLFVAASYQSQLLEVLYTTMSFLFKRVQGTTSTNNGIY